MGTKGVIRGVGKWVEYNPNPTGRRVGDCSVRAVSKALDLDWEEAYIKIVAAGLKMGDMPSSNSVWGVVLRENGYMRQNIPNTCPDCYTVKDFCDDHPEGIFVLGTGSHVVTVEDGHYYDAWDSGDEVPIYYWEKQ